jgi:hypothetical protein
MTQITQRWLIVPVLALKERTMKSSKLAAISALFSALVMADTATAQDRGFPRIFIADQDGENVGLFGEIPGIGVTWLAALVP